MEDERGNQRLRVALYITTTVQSTRHRRPELRQSSLWPALSPLYCLTDGQGRLCCYHLGFTRRSQPVASGVEKIELVGRCGNAVRKAWTEQGYIS
jgi:hypothetical protein